METNILLVIFVFSLICTAKELPSFLHVCHRSDPEMEKCLIQSSESIRSHLITGVPEYNIPSVEPLIIKDLMNEEFGGLTLTASDIVAYGGSKFNLKNIKVDMDAMKFTLEIDLPELKMEARYSAQGNIMVLQIKGNGNFYGNITDCKAHAIFQGELYEENNDTYLRFESNSIKAQVGSGHVKIDNLFGGDKILNDFVNNNANKNLHLYLKLLMPVVEKALASEFLDIVNRIVKQFTYEQLFPN